LPALKRACLMIFRVLSIFGGTTEIQKEIIARGLGL
jgi:alkylation response protein AidB-like acyl-CoA dehydrogenase